MLNGRGKHDEPGQAQEVDRREEYVSNQDTDWGPASKHAQGSQANGASNSKESRGTRQGLLGMLDWYLAWALPGLGMFSVAYIIFSVGQIGVFQEALWPSCFVTTTDCEASLVDHVGSYIQICGIMAGMLVFGFLASWTGLKWGSRLVAVIMLSGCVLLIFTPWATTPNGYLTYFLVAQTWFGFGVGGEYPMASAAASERSSASQRGRQVLLVFSNQGLGTCVNGLVFLAAMAIFNQRDSSTLTFTGAQSVLALTYGVGAVICTLNVLHCFIGLHESKMYEGEEQAKAAQVSGVKQHWVSLCCFWPRLLVASFAWTCNDFIFYGNKLQQDLFITLLHPEANAYAKQKWVVLNSFVALAGYYLAACVVDKWWYGRVRMQLIGFSSMAVLYFIIYGNWESMGAPGASIAGMNAFQALYYLTSFFTQFGPNATTWLVAGEIFPTSIRARYLGLAATTGKLGAITASIWISFISNSRQVFLLSAVCAILGAGVTLVFLPDTTGLQLQEYDRMQALLLQGLFKDYHGEAINPKRLSLWERYMLKWQVQYRPELAVTAATPVSSFSLQIPRSPKAVCGARQGKEDLCMVDVVVMQAGCQGTPLAEPH